MKNRIGILVVCALMFAGIAQGKLVITTGNNWTFTPAVNNLIAGASPSAVVNVSANAEGSPGPEVLTDGLAAADIKANCYTVGNNAVLTYALGSNEWGYDLTGLNFYTWWGNRDNITITSIAYETVDNPDVWVAIDGAALNYIAGPKVYAKYTDTTGLMAKYVKQVRISFGAQENNYVGYIELEITGTASSEPDYYPVVPFSVADLDTDSTAFTSSNQVQVLSFPVPPAAPTGVDRWMVTESGEVDAVASGTWMNTNALPSELTFTQPVGDTNIVLYAWFTNSMESVLLRRSNSQTLRYTTNAPVVSARSTYSRGLPSGGEVVVEVWHVDTGTTGGTSSGIGIDNQTIPIDFMGLEVVSGPEADLDASDETVTLNESGSYVLEFMTRNAAGNTSSKTIALTVTDVAGGTYTWTGAAGTTTWLEPLNWDLNAAPGPGDNIIVNSGTTFKPALKAGTYPASGSYGTFTIGSGAVVTCKGDPTAVNAASGGTALVPHGSGVTINCTDATINGTLTADNQGFFAETGPAGSSQGATHGGVNYSGYEAFDPSVAYGSIQQPTALGSGGNVNAAGAASGGGAIKLQATGNLTVDGLITAQGYSRATGGSLWLVADTFSGGGIINADGSPAVQGGGGGRVAIEYTTSSFTGTVSVKGGDTANSDGSEGTLWEPKRFAGMVGTPEAPVDVEIKSSYSYVFPDETVHYWNLSVTNGSRVEFHSGKLALNDLTLKGASTLRFDKWFIGCPENMADLTIANLNVLDTSVLCLPAAEAVGRYDLAELNIASGAQVYLGWGNFAAINADSGGTPSAHHGAGVEIVCANLNIAGLLSAKGRGFGTTSGPVYSSEGNSHGGRTGYNNGYGKLSRPTALGAGREVAGGGGAVKLVASGLLTLSGTISADARDGRSAGGSVWIQAGTLTGAGLVTARCGMDARPGGGGRIAIETLDDAGFTGQIKVTGRFGQYNDKSYPGTVFHAELANADAFAADGGVDLDATYSTSISDGTIFPEYVTNGTGFDIEDAIVVTRVVTRWSSTAHRYTWTESCSKKSTGNPIANTANYRLENLPVDTRFVIKDNGVLLEDAAFWESDAEGLLSFSVPLGTETHTVEVKAWTPSATVLVIF